MKNFFYHFYKYLDSKALKLIDKCLLVSIFMCVVSILLLYYYNSHYISNIIFKTSIILFRTGLMVGLFPIAFTLIIGKWNSEN